MENSRHVDAMQTLSDGYVPVFAASDDEAAAAKTRRALEERFRMALEEAKQRKVQVQMHTSGHYQKRNYEELVKLLSQVATLSLRWIWKCWIR